MIIWGKYFLQKVTNASYVHFSISVNHFAQSQSFHTETVPGIHTHTHHAVLIRFIL